MTGAFSFEKAFCQSYIQNGSFESKTDCPKFWSEKGDDFKGEFWYSPSKATPDLYSSCSEQCNNQSNWIDASVKTSDDCYAGMIMRQKDKSYSEYLQTKLTEPLVANELYKVRFKVYWAEKSRFGPVIPGVLLSTIPINSKKESNISATNIKMPAMSLDTFPKNRWVELELIFKASGGEKFFTIGCFDHKSELKEASFGLYDFCYYFVDDISIELHKVNYAKQSSNNGPNVISSFEYLDDVTADHQPENCTCWNCMILSGKVDSEITTMEDLGDFSLSAGQRIDMNKVVFDFESGELIESSGSELNRLIFILMEEPTAELRFVIYTYPNNPDGKSIAKESALKIYNYLKSKGLKNSFSYIHAEKGSLSQKDGIPRDRNVELYVVNK
ncbi:MAG: hypothetical protein H6599_02205 [Flavobacteriales bacterium]|nr:hypothetical protein [Flavobacteriales bacterium]